MTRIAAEELFNRKLIKCPVSSLLCQFSYRPEAGLVKSLCFLQVGYQSCDRIQEELEGRRKTPIWQETET